MHVVIIGNGVAGVAAARTIRKRSDAQITIVSSESPHFFSRPALMYIYMGHMEFDHTKPYEDHFWKKNRIDLVQARAEAIDTTTRTVALNNGTTLHYDALVLATGSRTAFYDWPGQNLRGVHGFTTLQDLAAIETSSVGARKAIVVGGGLIGVEVAEMLHARGIDVTMLVRESAYWRNVLPPEEATIIGAHLTRHGIDVRFNTQLRSIEGTECVRGVTLANGETIACNMVMICTGVQPVTDLAHRSGIAVQRGIVVNDYFETSAPNVYAVGDCAEQNGIVELLWYSARAHGEHVGAVICGDRTPYARDVFYNSAKFFDIEYQTYGSVPADLDGITSIVWQHVHKDQFLRIAHRDGIVCGFNALGLRLRAEVCMQWIRTRTPVDVVLRDLKRANFNEEFFAWEVAV
jgi:NAD(P)H-nitrite reductase large subunit